MRPAWRTPAAPSPPPSASCSGSAGGRGGRPWVGGITLHRTPHLQARSAPRIGGLIPNMRADKPPPQAVPAPTVPPPPPGRPLRPPGLSNDLGLEELVLLPDEVELLLVLLPQLVQHRLPHPRHLCLLQVLGAPCQAPPTPPSRPQRRDPPKMGGKYYGIELIHMCKFWEKYFASISRKDNQKNVCIFFRSTSSRQPPHCEPPRPPPPFPLPQRARGGLGGGGGGACRSRAPPAPAGASAPCSS